MFEKLPISEVCSLISRGISPAYDDEGIPVLSQKCIRDNLVLLEAARITNPDKKKVPNEKLVRLHDVLVNSTGVGTLGRVAQVKRLKGQVVVDSHVSIVRPDASRIDPLFFGYAMVLNQPRIEGMGEGATGQTELSRTRLGAETYVPIPPLPIQRRIAGILSAYDELIENSQRRIKILENMARALYREWFVEFRFPGHESVPRVPSPLGEIPKGWEVRELGEIVDFKSGFAFKSSSFVAGGQHRLVTIRNVQDGAFNPESDTHISQLPEKLPSYCTLHNGDILLSLTGNVGRVCLVFDGPFLLNQRVSKLVPVDDIDRALIYCIFRESGMRTKLEQLSNGVAQQNLSPVLASKIKVAQPTLELRQQICAATEPMIRHIVQHYCAIQNLRRTRDLLLPRLLSGEIALEA